MQITQFDDWKRGTAQDEYPMNCLPYYCGMTFNDLGDFDLFPASKCIHVPDNPGEKLLPQLAYIKQEGERLRAEAKEKYQPERWKNTRYLGQMTMQWVPQEGVREPHHDRPVPQKYIPGDTVHNHQLASKFVLMAIEHGNLAPWMK